ncbi:MAG TPA: hypothetical protein VIV12_17935 [Streptosporangiaceae bacterium]
MERKVQRRSKRLEHAGPAAVPKYDLARQVTAASVAKPGWRAKSWIMSQEWFNACLAVRWPGDDPGMLHGLPITVDEREGFPRVDQYTRVRDGQGGQDVTAEQSGARQARLPRNWEQPTIATMEFGQTLYTVPWAMRADEDRQLWLHPDFPTENAPQGTVMMRVELRDDGYHVWPVSNHSYQPAPAVFAGKTSQPFIPVAVLHG